ncbi:MAG: hypothetical protein OJF51_004353 [Nitrospira sp.]|nr:MAG: hypothetical protein OJF51_004353 [Nitrospira sp.]
MGPYKITMPISERAQALLVGIEHPEPGNILVSQCVNRLE